MRMCHFRAQNTPIFPKQNFWYKPLLLLSSIYWPFSLGKILKQFLQRIQSDGDQKDPFPQIIIFSENLLMSLVSFIHAYLNAKNQSQIFIYWLNIDD